MAPRAFAAVNRLYLPEYKSKQELARGLEAAVHAMLHGKQRNGASDTAYTAYARARCRMPCCTSRLRKRPATCSPSLSNEGDLLIIIMIMSFIVYSHGM